MKFAAVFAAAALFTSAFAAPALATDMPATQSVRTADINMTTAAGAEQMLRRIRYAAKMVCGVDGGVVSMSQRARGRACVRDTIASTVSQLNQPMVTARYIERNGGGAALGGR